VKGSEVQELETPGQERAAWKEVREEMMEGWAKQEVMT
jgi:hypothetical protein